MCISMSRRDCAKYDDVCAGRLDGYRMSREAGCTTGSWTYRYQPDTQMGWLELPLPQGRSSRGRGLGWSEHVVVVYGADAALIQVSA